MKHEYPIQVVWSIEDEAYIAIAVGLHGCVADGKSPEEAVANIRGIIQEWIEIAREDGREIPAPLNFNDVEKLQRQSETELQKHIEKEVKKAVAAILSQVAQSQQAGQNWGHRFGTGLVSFEKTPPLAGSRGR